MVMAVSDLRLTKLRLPLLSKETGIKASKGVRRDYSAER